MQKAPPGVAGTACSSRQMQALKADGILELKDLAGSEYVGALGVGTSREGTAAAELSVVYDTGSADLWIASDLCTQGPCVALGRHRFNRSTSRTFHQEESLCVEINKRKLALA